MSTQVTTPCPASTDVARRILVVGGGYAGATLAVGLGKALRKRPQRDVEVVLIEPNPCQQALSELDLVAVGPDHPEFCELWLPAVLKDLPVRTCFNRVEHIDPVRRVVVTTGGHEVSYWRLAICTGAIPFVPPVPGLAEQALTMWSVEDAQRLQRRINEQLRIAATLPTREQRQAALSVTVCGGGATGVEIVGTIGQLLPKRAAGAGLDRDDLRITLIEGRPQILYDLSEDQRTQAIRRLERLGVNVVTGSMVSSVDSSGVTLADGRHVDSSVLVWCGGAKADPDATDWGFAHDNAGRLIGDAYLRAEGFEDVYVLGDVAAIKDPETRRTLPMLAQFAIREGQHAVTNIMNEVEGKELEAYHPHMHGEFVSIGPSWGIGWAWKVKLVGVPAIIMKRLTYVMYWWQVGGIKLAWQRGKEMAAMQR